MEAHGKRQIRTMVFAIVLVAVTWFTLSRPSKPVPAQVMKASAEFNSGNYNNMKVDTFVRLLQLAYGSLMDYKIDGNLLRVNLKYTNELTQDFFNGNARLLQYNLNQFGFDINYNKEQRSIDASFRINSRNGVNVPNDVLIPLTSKTNKISNVDYSK
jgi:hypothetical protein